MNVESFREYISSFHVDEREIETSIRGEREREIRLFTHVDHIYSFSSDVIIKRCKHHEQ